MVDYLRPVGIEDNAFMDKLCMPGTPERSVFQQDLTRQVIVVNKIFNRNVAIG